MSVKAIPVNDYVDKLLKDKASISSAEMNISSDFDYVMLMMLTMEYDTDTSPYRLKFSGGQAVTDRYSVPNIIISRK